MKAHIGVNAASGLVHTVRGTAGHVTDVAEGNALLHGQETVVFADAGYQGAGKRPDARPDVQWQVAMRPGKRKKLDKASLNPTLLGYAALALMVAFLDPPKIDKTRFWSTK